MTKRPIRLAYMDTATGDWVTLATYSDYDRADRALERLSEDFPHMWLDLLDGALTPA